jgi:hypothetical protein
MKSRAREQRDGPDRSRTMWAEKMKNRSQKIVWPHAGSGTLGDDLL